MVSQNRVPETTDGPRVVLVVVIQVRVVVVVVQVHVVGVVAIVLRGTPKVGVVAGVVEVAIVVAVTRRESGKARHDLNAAAGKCRQKVPEISRGFCRLFFCWKGFPPPEGRRTLIGFLPGPVGQGTLASMLLKRSKFYRIHKATGSPKFL